MPCFTVSVFNFEHVIAGWSSTPHTVVMLGFLYLSSCSFGPWFTDFLKFLNFKVFLNFHRHIIKKLKTNTKVTLDFGTHQKQIIHF